MAADGRQFAAGQQNCLLGYGVNGPNPGFLRFLKTHTQGLHCLLCK